MNQSRNNHVPLGTSVLHQLSTTDAEIIAIGDVPVASCLMFTHKQNLEDDGLTLTPVATQSYQAKCTRQIAEFHSYRRY